MADAQRTIDIIFNAINETGEGLSSIADDLQSLSDEASNVTGPLAEIADQAVLTESAILSMGAAFLTVSVNEASQFSEKIEEIGSLVNAQPDDIGALKTAVQEFASDSVSNFDAIGQAVYVATSNLGDTSAAMDVLVTAEKGAQVGATDLETSTALLTRTMNAYGLVTDDSKTNTENAERVMAAMFVTVQNGDINMGALADNMGKVASTAAAAGIPIETVGAALAALTGAGVNAEQSTTLLNAVIKELLKPSDDLTAALGGLSVTTDGLPAVMDALKNSTGGSAEKLFALFSSSEAAKGALILANDSAGKFDGTLTAMSTSVSAFNTNYQNMSGGVDDSTQKLVNNTTILLQKVGEPLQDGWASILDGLSSIVQGFSLSIDEGAFEPVFTAFDGFGTDISDTLKRIGDNLPAALEQVDWSGLIAVLGDLGIEIGDLFDGVDLSSPEGLANAIQFVVDSFASLTAVVSGIVDVWGPVVQGFIAGTDAFNDLDNGAKKTFGQLTGLAEIFETLKGSVTTGADALDTIGSSLQALAGINAASTIASLTTALGTSVSAVGSAGLVGAAALAAGAVGYTAGSGLAWGLDQLISKATGTSTSLGGLIFDLTHSGEAATAAVTSVDKMGDAIKGTGEKTITATSELKRISDETGVLVTSSDDLKKAMDAGLITFDAATNSFIATGTGIRDFDAEVAAATTGSGTFADKVLAISESLGLVSDSGETVIDSFTDMAAAESAAMRQFDDGHEVFIRYEDGMYKVVGTGKDLKKSQDEVAKAVEDTSKSNVKGSTEWVNVMQVMQDATNAANDFRIKAEEITERRYEANLSALVDLRVAEIEADTARIAAAFDSLNAGIASTGETLVGLAEIFANSGNLDEAKQQFLQDLVIAEEARRQSQFDLQKELIDNQNEYLKAKINRLNSGQSLITIESGTLAPELDSLLSKVMQMIQIKATDEGASLLLGFGND